MRRLLPGLTAAALLAAGTPSAQTQEPFRAGTTLVPVDVRVVDREGNPITDLKKDDFTILEDKVPQTIAQFATQAYTAEPAAPPTRPRRAADAYEVTSTNQRTWLIALGRGRLQGPADGMDAMLQFVGKQMLPQDQVAVMGWNRATDFTSDHTQSLAVLERFKERNVFIEWQLMTCGMPCDTDTGEMPEWIQRNIDDVFGGPHAPNQRTLGTAKDAVRVRQTAQQIANQATGMRSELERISLGMEGLTLDDFIARKNHQFEELTKFYLGIEYLRHIAGEKHLVFLSEYGLPLDMMELERGLGRTAADARVVIDIIHSGGVSYQMKGSSPTVFQGPPAYREFGTREALTARNLTAMTGGRFFARKLPKAWMDTERIEDAARFSYTLGYSPARQDWDGEYRTVVVKVNRPGLTVLYRDGYFARRELGPIDRRAAMARGRVVTAAEEHRIIPDLAVQDATAALAGSGMGRTVTVSMRLDLSRVEFEKREGQNVAAIDVAAFAVKGRKPVGQDWTTVELTYTDARLEQVRREGLKRTITFSVSDAADAVKIVAYDYGADLIGSAVAKIK